MNKGPQGTAGQNGKDGQDGQPGVAGPIGMYTILFGRLILRPNISDNFLIVENWHHFKKVPRVKTAKTERTAKMEKMAKTANQDCLAHPVTPSSGTLYRIIYCRCQSHF